jgi:hypothetical protein
MNDIVENHVAYDPLRAPLSPDSAKTTVDYIDIWNMSIQRPDAHLNPGGDCLHFCPIGVTTQWIQVGWVLPSSLGVADPLRYFCSSNGKRCFMIPSTRTTRWGGCDV